MNALDLARQHCRAMRFFTQSIADEKMAAQIPDLYPRWRTQQLYQMDEYAVYGTDENGKTQVYKCMQQHFSQDGWTPDVEMALWKRIGYDIGYELWAQPLGASDAYKTGDKVSHGGVIYVSNINANIWEPGVYGWEVFVS